LVVALGYGGDDEEYPGVTALSLRPDGTIAVEAGEYAARINADGTLDRTFVAPYPIEEIPVAEPLPPCNKNHFILDEPCEVTLSLEGFPLARHGDRPLGRTRARAP
jgi:hypothetical protein